MKNLNGISVILLCLLLVFVVLLITGKVIIIKTIGLAAIGKIIGLSVLITAALFAAAFGIYCLVDWIKEKKKKQVDGK